MSFTHRQVKYFAPFYKDEEFSIKPKFYETTTTDGDATTLLDILSSMFRRKMLGDDDSSTELSRRYWKRIVEEERRVSVLLIFSDKLYRQYPSQLVKPTKNVSAVQDNFVTIRNADAIVPNELLQYFWPKDLMPPDPDDRLTGIRLKIRISGEHVHPRSIVVPYDPVLILEDEHILAVNKPFGIPSMGETNNLSSPDEWNSILMWCRRASEYNKDDKRGQSSTKQGTVCDLMNRLDLDVSGLVLLGKGAYRRKRGFAGESTNKDPSRTTVKVYLGIIPFQEKAIRITTPKLAFDRRQAKAVIKEEKDGTATGTCKTSIYPLLDLGDSGHSSLVAICLEESGQRHQIRFHLSLIGAAISNDTLYQSTGGSGGSKVRTGVASSRLSQRDDDSAEPTAISNKTEALNNPLIKVQVISEQEKQQFLNQYVYTNGVIGFQRTKSHVNNHLYTKSLIRRSLYPFEDEGFSDALTKAFTHCSYCGKCQALAPASSIDMNSEEGRPGADSEEHSQTVISHGIYLHSWRYFYPTDEYPLLEASLPGTGVNENKHDQAANAWWPVQILCQQNNEQDA